MQPTLRRSIAVTAAVLFAVTSLPGTLVAGHKRCSDSVDNCVTVMVKKLDSKGWVGIELDREDDGSLAIHRVVPDSPAAAAGLQAGDRIVALNGVSYVTAGRAALKKAYRVMVPDATITYTIDRGGSELEVSVTLAPLPEDLRAQWIAHHLVEGHMHAHAGKKP